MSGCSVKFYYILSLCTRSPLDVVEPSKNSFQALAWVAVTAFQPVFPSSRPPSDLLGRTSRCHNLQGHDSILPVPVCRGLADQKKKAGSGRSVGWTFIWGPRLVTDASSIAHFYTTRQIIIQEGRGFADVQLKSQQDDPKRCLADRLLK